ncbi:MAG: 30S ribosomal protein S21 [Bacteroidetes bacterium]|jgi:small subunit ribosomal protein S21|nr:30S ribosomal protein S21 [Bacteroidota bacterium]
MLSIPVKENDNIERCLKRFKKKFDRTKKMKELRSRREFVKPSLLNREAMKKAIYKNGKSLKEDYYDSF